MIRVGLTGGIGSGKTFISNHLRKMGYPVYSSDENAKRLMAEDKEVVTKIKSLFGKEAYKNEDLQRNFLAKKIFTQASLREKLNAIVHPAVRKDFEEWCKRQETPIVFNEAAILFETGRYKDFDFTVLVTAPRELRIKRVMKRDNVKEEEVLSRINSQWGEEKKKELASFSLKNEGGNDLHKELDKIIQEITEKTKIK